MSWLHFLPQNCKFIIFSQILEKLHIFFLKNDNSVLTMDLRSRRASSEFKDLRVYLDISCCFLMDV